jgi:hypothetical protein
MELFSSNPLPRTTARGTSSASNDDDTARYPPQRCERRSDCGGYCGLFVSSNRAFRRHRGTSVIVVIAAASPINRCTLEMMAMVLAGSRRQSSHFFFRSSPAINTLSLSQSFPVSCVGFLLSTLACGRLLRKSETSQGCYRTEPNEFWVTMPRIFKMRASTRSTTAIQAYIRIYFRGSAP